MRRLALLTLCLLAAGCDPLTPKASAAEPATLRLGYFPNLTHAQAVVGDADGTFAKALGSAKLSTKKFNAGPEAMQALLAGELDASYVGSGPAINAYLQSKGALRVVAGGTSGGAVFVTRTARSAEELKGKRIATPQLGNTQDISLRYWLMQHGMKPSVAGGGPVTIVPVSNPDILSLFLRGDIEGAWVPEPWGARLIAEAGAKLFIDERDLWPERKFATTVIVASKKALDAKPQLIEALVRAHAEITKRAAADREGFGRLANEQLGKLTQHPLKPEVLSQALSRIDFTTDPMEQQLAVAADHAHQLGFLPTADIKGLVDTRFLSAAKGVGGAGKAQ